MVYFFVGLCEPKIKIRFKVNLVCPVLRNLCTEQSHFNLDLKNENIVESKLLYFILKIGN